MRGTFVTFEGCEGVGKSTQLNFLRDYLEQTDQPALFTREPGGSHISEQVRSILLSPENKDMVPLTEALLYAAARAQHMKEVIIPALEQGQLVICDRFIDSSLAYQGHARGLGFDTVYEINKPALFGVLPDVTVFIDLSPAEAFRSKAKTAAMNDRFEQESVDFHEKVYEGYTLLANKYTDRFKKIKPSLEKTETAKSIIAVLQKLNIIK